MSLDRLRGLNCLMRLVRKRAHQCGLAQVGDASGCPIRMASASAIVIAHNHPSGIAEPSQADEFITQRVKEALALVDIRLLDHIIVGDGACVSLAERGVL